MAAADDHVTITTTENGPYIVRGKVTVLDVDGNEHDTGGRDSIALCRCGASTKKPFCDGTHSKVGFAAVERAVSEGEGA